MLNLLERKRQAPEEGIEGASLLLPPFGYKRVGRGQLREGI